jgi:calcineurin-like phosphoesterase family protein
MDMEYDAFTSDPHYFHKKIIEYCGRPFSSVEEMNETMIKNYNSVIGPNDRVLWCGDSFFAKMGNCHSVMKRLNGKKDLVLGNHDYQPHMMVDMGFSNVMHRVYGRLGGRNVVANHFDQWKYRSIWDDRFQDLRFDATAGEIVIHGHSHSKQKSFFNQVHVGVDAWNFTPALRHEVEEIIAAAPKNFREYREKEALFFEYKRILKNDLNDPILNNEEFQFLRALGWHTETRSRKE